jgi:Mg/Co/Ni transporter MgtE
VPGVDWQIRHGVENTFVTTYAKKNPREDFAEHFEEYFRSLLSRSTGGIAGPVGYQAKLDFTNRMLNGMALGHSPSVVGGHSPITMPWEEVSPADVGKFLKDSLGKVASEALGAIMDHVPVDLRARALAMLDLGQVTSIVAAMNPMQIAEMLRPEYGWNEGSSANLIVGFDGRKLAAVFGALDSNTLQGVFGHLSASKIADALQYVNGSTLERALGQLTDTQIVEIFEPLNTNTLGDALSYMGAARIANILQYVTPDTLNSSLLRMSVEKIAQVFEPLNTSTLGDALSYMDPSRIADVLKRVTGATLNSSLKRMSVDKIAQVFEPLNTNTLKDALGYMDASRIAEVLNRVTPDTLKSSVKRLEDAKLIKVIPQVGQGTARAINDYLKKADPGRFNKLFGSKPRSWWPF